MVIKMLIFLTDGLVFGSPVIIAERFSAGMSEKR